MSAAAAEPDGQRPTDETLLRQEEEAAAEEAGEIGGEVPRDSDDPAQQPLIEAGQGESEGFELAEKDLREIAEHGDERSFPDGAVPAPEERSDAEYGEPDLAIPEDGSDD